MYQVRVLLIFAAIYFGLHTITGYFHCKDNFCPGDSERDYVYTIKDGDGKIWYMENGKAISEDDYKRAHANLFEFVEKEDKNGKE